MVSCSLINLPIGEGKEGTGEARIWTSDKLGLRLALQPFITLPVSKIGVVTPVFRTVSQAQMRVHALAVCQNVAGCYQWGNYGDQTVMDPPS